MITPNDIDLIDRHINGSLQPEEVQYFEARMKSDLEFAREVQFVKDLGIGIRKANRTELKKKLQKISTENNDQTAVGIELRKSYVKYYAIAATVLLLVAMTWVVYYFGFSGRNFNSGFTDSTKQNKIFDIHKYIADNYGKVNHKSFKVSAVGESGYGYAAADTIQIETVLIHNEVQYQYYFMRDTLYLIGPFQNSNLSLYKYNDSAGGYFVVRYLEQLYKIKLVPTDSVSPLIPTKDSLLINYFSKNSY